MVRTVAAPTREFQVISKNVWIAGGIIWLGACGGNGGGGAVDGGDGKKDPPTIEQRREQMRACIRQRLPGPDDTQEWEVSGYALVDAYVKCQEKPADATAADFRAVVREMARPVEGEPSRVRLIAPSRGSP